MANTAHLFRRQSSRDLNNGSHRDYTKTLDELELKVVKTLQSSSASNIAGFSFSAIERKTC